VRDEEALVLATELDQADAIGPEVVEESVERSVDLSGDP
jgi:hypothetical protein